MQLRRHPIVLQGFVKMKAIGHRYRPVITRMYQESRGSLRRNL